MRERTFAPSQGPPSEAEFLVTIIAQRGSGGGFGESGFKKSNWNIANLGRVIQGRNDGIWASAQRQKKNQEEGKEESSKLAEKQPQHAHKSLTLSLLSCYLIVCVCK